ncbi:MAG: hypothetical protein EHM48_09115, partial [Planctomycetaceae bacterium]
AEDATKVNNFVGEIAAASKEQAQGIEQISTGVSQMDTITQQNAANAEESASASEELSAQAEDLNGIVCELMAIISGAAVTTNADRNPSKVQPGERADFLAGSSDADKHCKHQTRRAKYHTNVADNNPQLTQEIARQ